MGVIENFSLFPVVIEFWKSVEIWQSYRHEFGGTLFWDTVYDVMPILRYTVLHLMSSELR